MSIRASATLRATPVAAFAAYDVASPFGYRLSRVLIACAGVRQPRTVGGFKQRLAEAAAIRASSVALPCYAP